MKARRLRRNDVKLGKISSLFILVLAAAIWGFAFVAQVEGMEHIAPFTMTGARFTLSALCLLPLALIFERGRTESTERKRTFWVSVLGGVVLFCASSLQQFGCQYTPSAGMAGFMTALYTVITPIACFLIFKQKTKLNVWISAVLAVAGLCMLCFKSGEGLTFGVGEILLLLGAFFWTAHIIVIDRFASDIRPFHFCFGQFAVCAVLGLISMFLFEEPSAAAMWDGKMMIIYCGVFSGAMGYTLQVIGQKGVNPTLAAIVLSTESVFSAIGGVIFGIDRISLVGYLGCAVIFAGIIISQLDFSRKTKEERTVTYQSKGE